MTHYTITESPIGPLLLTSDGSTLTGLFLDASPDRSWEYQPDTALFSRAREQLNAYFSGQLTVFDLPLAPCGTQFQRRVWKELRAIPYGETVSYADLARRIEAPGACRAVGRANGANPIAIIIPCHRVIGASGRLVGYGGGLRRKAALLALEAGGALKAEKPEERMAA